MTTAIGEICARSQRWVRLRQAHGRGGTRAAHLKGELGGRVALSVLVLRTHDRVPVDCNFA